MNVEHAFLARITRPYGELVDLFNEWSKQCSRMWVYEHEADEEVNRTHCHVVVSGSKRDFDNLKKLKSWIKMNIEKGNAGSSSKTYSRIYDLDMYNGTVVNEKEYWFNCLKYGSKGKVETLKFISGDWSGEWAENSRLKWEEIDKSKEQKSNNMIVHLVKEPKKRITQFKIAELAEAQYLAQYPTEIDEGLDIDKLQDIIISLCRQNSMLCHTRLVVNIIEHIATSISKVKFKRKVTKLLSW